MEIRKYVALLWQWAWLVILGVVIAAGVAYIVSINTTPVYQASARLLIDQAPGASSNTYADVLTIEKISQTYVELLTVSDVLNEVITELNLPIEASGLRRQISASAPADTQILNITVQDTNPERAAAIANSTAEAFIRYNERTQLERYADPMANLQTELDTVGDQIELIETNINTLATSGELSPAQQADLSRLETQLKEQQTVYNNIFNDLQSLRVKSATESNKVLIVEPASPNDSPIRPRTLTNTLLAAAVGGMLALGVIFLIDYLDDTIKTPDQVTQDTGLSAIGVISYIKGDEPPDRLITHTTPRAPTSEAYRVLRTNLEFSSIDDKLRSVLVTSPSPGEGKSTTAANLGTVVAQAGNRVIIVDADLRRPSQHKVFQVPNNQGLTTALLDSETPISYHIQQTKVPGLRIMTSGPLPPNPSELLRSHRMQQILAELNDEADFVIVDTPPTLTVADASILAPRVGGGVIVLKIASTRRDALIQAQESLHKTGAHVLGVVMNHATPGRGGYYNYYYYRYYNYEYGDKKPTKSRNPLARWLAGANK
ncbi:MAG: polysaccharide biosynthesis tyrosine autokinase [Anaerolineales bacterium]|nr:polysaccharide biosynthesis tyrosine autokinase [Anaerolineales bacterium]